MTDPQWSARMTIQHCFLAIILLCTQHVAFGDAQNCILDLQVNSKNKSYDLTSVAYSPVTVPGRWSGRSAEAVLQLCAQDGPCAAPAAACVTGADQKKLVANAGTLTNSTAFVVKDSSQLQLDLAPGQQCLSQGRNTTFNTTILFVCEPDDQGAEERQQPVAVLGDCSLTVIWYTPDACGRSTAAPPACPLLAFGPLRHQPGLAGLADARWHAQDPGVTVQLRLCGGAASEEAACAGAPVCRTDAGQTRPVGAADRPARLATASNGSVTLTYGRPGEERAEVSLLCSEDAGAGRLVLRHHEQQLVQLALETAVVCPVRSVDCQVTAEDGTVRDLSSLTLETGAWETTDHASGRTGDHFLINMCRALSHDSLQEICGGVSGTAVCLRSGSGALVSLGAVAGPPTLMADGSIAIVYTNGSACGGGRYSSELQLVCGREQDGAPLLVDRDGCRFTFLWETPAACGQQESSGPHCAVSEPLYGHRLDVSSLRRADSDYSLHLDGSTTLYLNLCGPLLRPCAGAAASAGACLVHANGTETSYGGASSRLWHSDGALSLRLTAGARCEGGSGASAGNHSTRVVFTCDQRAPAAVEPGLVHLGCTTFVVVPARQACPPRRAADCRTPDGRYDLSGLTALTGNHEYRETGSTYVLNVCHSVNPEQGVNCPPESAACLVLPNGNGTQKSYTSLGAVSGGPQLEDDRLVLRYSGGQPCGDNTSGTSGTARRLRTTEIRFSCDPTALGTQPRLVSADDCLYRFAWTTAGACPLREARAAANCTVENPLTGYSFDLSPLARSSGYTTELRGAHYQLNVCAALSETSGCKAGAGICKTDAENPSTKLSAGSANDNLVFDDGVLLLNYGDGAPCPGGGGRRRSTVISFWCGAEDVPPEPRVVEDDGCRVTVHWPTQLACETRVECAVDTTAGLVDLTPLVGLGAVSPAGGGSGTERFRVSVCRPLAPTAGITCPAGSAACRSDGDTHQGLGHVHSPPRFDSDHVTLTYEHGSACPGQPGRNMSTELQLYCDASRPASESGPERPVFADCRYTFRWRTAAACAVSPAAAQARRQCLVRRADGAVSDLNTLTATRALQVHVSGQTVLLRPCHADLRCGGAVCVGDLSFGDEAGFTVSQPDDQSVTLEYTAADSACTQTDGSKTTRGATLHLTCDPTLGTGTPSVTKLTPCHVTVEWRSSAVCGAAITGGSSSGAATPAVRGTGHAVAWLMVVGVSAALVAFLVCRSRYRGCTSSGGASCGCCQVWGALKRQLLSPGTRASAHYRPVRVEDSDDAETALLLDAPLEEQHSPRPAPRRRPPGHSPPPPDMTDVCLDPSCDSDDEILIV